MNKLTKKTHNRTNNNFIEQENHKHEFLKLQVWHLMLMKLKAMIICLHTTVQQCAKVDSTQITQYTAVAEDCTLLSTFSIFPFSQIGCQNDNENRRSQKQLAIYIGHQTAPPPPPQTQKRVQAESATTQLKQLFLPS